MFSRRWCFVLLLLTTTSLIPQAFVHADTVCASELRGLPALTGRQLKDRSAARAQEFYKITPKPGFDNLEVQALIEQRGEVGPAAFQSALPDDVYFVNTPAPTSSDPIAVDLLEEGITLPLHVDQKWKGHRTSTTAFASLPRIIKPDAAKNPKRFLVSSSQYKQVVVHLHGGGTPTATGRNAMSIGKEIGKRGIPMIAIDLPGHGRATKNPDGLETFQDQVDWLLAIMDKLIDPDVEVILEGHSWGAIYALFMHRMSDDPKYARIKQFIALSPAVDPTLGGGAHAKLEFEQRMARDFELHKDRIAAGDFRFLSNILNNAKDSDISTIFTNLTDIDFNTPVMSPELQAKLKPLTVVVGEHDGLVYVGREEPYDKVFGNFIAKNRYIKMDKGLTFESKKPEDFFDVGHNIFPFTKGGRFENGELVGAKSIVYELIADTVLGEGVSIPPDENIDPVDALYDRAFRANANFFAYRELLNGRVEYVKTDTELKTPISRRRGQLEGFINKVNPLRTQLAKIEEAVSPIPSIEKALDDLRKGLGITDTIAYQRAVDDLRIGELTPARKTALEEYIQKCEDLEQQLLATTVDEKYLKDVATLNIEHKDLLAANGWNSILEYGPAYQETQSTKDNSKEGNLRRKLLSNIHKNLTEMLKDKQKRFEVEKEAAMKTLTAPAGVTDRRSATRELFLDRSPERRERLRQYIAKYDETERAARALAITTTQAQIAAVALPPDTASFEDAVAQRDEAMGRLGQVYAPPEHPEIQLIADQIRKLDAELDTLERGEAPVLGVEALENFVSAQRKERTSLLKEWDFLWASQKISSPAAAQAQQSVDAILVNYKALYLSYEDKKGDYILSLEEKGQRTAENLLNMPPDLLDARRAYQQAKRVFNKNRTQLEKLRWVEGVAGRLTGDSEVTQRAHDIALTLWGASYVATRKPSPESMTANLGVEEQYLANRQAKRASLKNRLGVLRSDYTDLMLKLEQPVPILFQAVDVNAMLKSDYAPFEANLRSNPNAMTALTQTQSDWTGFLKRFRDEAGAKADDVN